MPPEFLTRYAGVFFDVRIFPPKRHSNFQSVGIHYITLHTITYIPLHTYHYIHTCTHTHAHIYNIYIYIIIGFAFFLRIVLSGPRRVVTTSKFRRGRAVL